MSSRLVKQQLANLQAEVAVPSKGVAGAAAGVQKRKQRKQRKALARAAAKQPAQDAKGVRARNLAYYKATAGGSEDTAAAELMAQVLWGARLCSRDVLKRFLQQVRPGVH
jgi:hypothetical protein